MLPSVGWEEGPGLGRFKEGPSLGPGPPQRGFLALSGPGDCQEENEVSLEGQACSCFLLRFGPFPWESRVAGGGSLLEPKVCVERSSRLI